MSMALHILHLEENDSDFELVHKHLSNEEIKGEVIRVSAEAEYLKYLPQTCWDLILIGCNSKNINGAQLVKHTRSLLPDTPLIVISNILGEKIAVDLLRNGVDDIFFKDSLEGLTTTIRKILKDREGFKEQKRMIESLQLSENNYRLLVENANSFILRISEEGTITFSNLFALNFFGYSKPEIIGKSVFGTILPSQNAEGKNMVEIFHELLLDSTAYSTIEVESILRNGKRVWIAWTHKLLQNTVGRRDLLLVGNDLTKIHQMEEQRRVLDANLQQMQKLESLGVLTGGIAHDYNNLLTGILGYAELALMDLPENSPAKEWIQQITKAGKRAAELTQQMLTYAGKSKVDIKTVDLSKLVHEMTGLIEASVSKKSLLKYQLMDDLPVIDADANQLRQVILNLIINASESMDPQGGLVEIRTGVQCLDRQYLGGCYLDDKLPEGYYVYLEVRDQGCGIAQDTLIRVFDPFFSTKFPGRGLGLAAVLGIVRGHRGTLKVSSEVKRGSVFKVFFPTSDFKALPISHPPSNTDTVDRKMPLVLVVDDEETVRKVAQKMLEKAGFAVLLASNGSDGMEKFRSRLQDIDVVLLDLSMPNMSGEEVFHNMRNLRRDIRVVLSSGYLEGEATHNCLGEGLAGFVQKPWQYDQLITAVQNALLKQHPFSNG